MLPALVLAASTVGLLTRFSRSAVLDVLDNDYVRTARAKGMPERVDLRDTSCAPRCPIITVLGAAVRDPALRNRLRRVDLLLAGLGQYAYHAATNLDLPAIMGVTIFVAIIYIVINFVVDILYGVIDPRIRLTT